MTLTEKIKNIDIQISVLEKQKEELIKLNEKRISESIKPGDRVRVLSDCWDGWGPSVGSECVVHRVGTINCWIGSSDRITKGTFWTSFDAIEKI